MHKYKGYISMVDICRGTNPITLLGHVGGVITIHTKHTQTYIAYLYTCSYAVGRLYYPVPNLEAQIDMYFDITKWFRYKRSGVRAQMKIITINKLNKITGYRGAAPTTSFDLTLLASMDWAKTAARRNERHWSLGIWCASYYGFYGDGTHHWKV